MNYSVSSGKAWDARGYPNDGVGGNLFRDYDVFHFKPTGNQNILLEDAEFEKAIAEHDIVTRDDKAYFGGELIRENYD